MSMQPHVSHTSTLYTKLLRREQCSSSDECLLSASSRHARMRSLHIVGDTRLSRL
jgi:hypothetical protein